MSDLEKSLKEQLESVINENQKLLEKHFEQDSKIVKLVGDNEYYKNKLQQKENIIKEYKKHIKNINKWLNYNTEIGNLYWYDTTPFPELKLSNEKSEVS